MKDASQGQNAATTGPSLRSLNEFLPSMNIQEARPSDAPIIASILQEAAEWLAGSGRPLWSAAEIGRERVQKHVNDGLFHIARQDGQLVGVMKFELEDAYFWPEVLPGTSASSTSSPCAGRGRRKASRRYCCHMLELGPSSLDVLTFA